MSLRISKHAIEQFQRRINPWIDTEKAKELIIRIFKESKYASDNDKGVLFRHPDLRIEIIVKNKSIVTIYPLTKSKGVKNGTK
jgi:phage pi2 protein 07